MLSNNFELAIVLGGPALFLLGESFFVLQHHGATNLKRLGAAVLLIALWPARRGAERARAQRLWSRPCALAVWVADARVAEKRAGLGWAAVTT